MGRKNPYRKGSSMRDTWLTASLLYYLLLCLCASKKAISLNFFCLFVKSHLINNLRERDYAHLRPLTIFPLVNALKCNIFEQLPFDFPNDVTNRMRAILIEHPIALQFNQINKKKLLQKCRFLRFFYKLDMIKMSFIQIILIHSMLH